MNHQLAHANVYIYIYRCTPCRWRCVCIEKNTHCLCWKGLYTLYCISCKWRIPKYIKVCNPTGGPTSAHWILTKVTLGPTALLQDDGTDQLEVAFTLSFGQFDDPKDVPGLAHLTEHLLLSGPGPDGQQAGRLVDGEWSWKSWGLATRSFGELVLFVLSLLLWDLVQATSLRWVKLS